jgi:hypothetical protein
MQSIRKATRGHYKIISAIIDSSAHLLIGNFEKLFINYSKEIDCIEQIDQVLYLFNF